MGPIQGFQCFYRWAVRVWNDPLRVWDSWNVWGLAEHLEPQSGPVPLSGRDTVSLVVASRQGPTSASTTT